MGRHLVQIPDEQKIKLEKIDNLRPDLAGYPLSKKVNILLQEKLTEIYIKKDNSFEQKISEGDWLEYIREQIPLHTAAPIFLGMINLSEKQIGKGFTRQICANNLEKTWWISYKQDMDDVGEYIINKLLDEKFSKKYYKKYYKNYNNIKKNTEKIIKTDLKSKSNKKLLEIYHNLLNDAQNFHGLVLDIDAIDHNLEKKIKNELEKDSEKYYNILTTPIEFSYVSDENLLLQNIAKNINETNKNIVNKDMKTIKNNLRKNNPKIYKKIVELQEKYWWTSLGWSSNEIKTIESYLRNIKTILEEEKNIELQIKKIKENQKSSNIEKNNILKKINNKKLSKLIDIFDKYFIFHDFRKEMQMKTMYAFNLILIELSNRTNYSISELLWSWPHEIENLIKTGQLNKQKTLERKESMYIFVTNYKIDEYTGNKARERIKEITNNQNLDLKDFRGTTASNGVYKGIAKICLSAKEASAKIKKGDILVASMTLPDYVPSMKKSGAIVTDEGGITCHAAIVSRELEIPCIIGTKNATKILKDGDLIEVNANHGVVKIIKNK